MNVSRFMESIKKVSVHKASQGSFIKYPIDFACKSYLDIIIMPILNSNARWVYKLLQWLKRPSVSCKHNTTIGYFMNDSPVKCKVLDVKILFESFQFHINLPEKLWLFLYQVIAPSKIPITKCQQYIFHLLLNAFMIP